MNVRNSIRTSTALLAVTVAITHAHAAEADGLLPAAAAEAPTEIVVTGTNLRRTSTEGALPVSVISADDIALRGGSTGADLFATLPMAAPPSINEATIGSQAARGDVMSVDLRGIGAGSTLMLINGRRVAAHPLSGTDQGVPALSANANVIPTALVSRVEILRDGASAIYGADAAAGVINSIVTPNTQGGRLSIETAQTQRGGAGEYRLTASDSFKLGRTSIGLSLDIFRRDKMMVNDRAWGADSDLRVTRDVPSPWNDQPVIDPVTGNAFALSSDFDNSSTITNFGQFRRGYIQPDFETFISGRPEGNAGIVTTGSPTGGVATMAENGTFFLVPDADGNINFKQSTPSRTPGHPDNAYYHNRLPHRVLIPGVKRVNAAMFIEHEASSSLTLFGDLMFSGARSTSQRESANLQNVNEPGIYVPMSNPYNPFGERFYHVDGLANEDGTPRIMGAPADVTIAAGTMPNGTRNRYIQVDSTFYRGLVGARGTLGDNWSWESGLMISGAYAHETETNIYRESLVRKALERTDATAYNPFPVTFKVVDNKVVVDKPFTNPTSVTDPMYDTDNRYGKTQIITWDAKLAGELFQLPFGGGRVQVAGGVESRWESYDAWKATYAGLNPVGSGADYPYLRENDNDFISMSPNANVSANQNVLSAYGEVSLPLITPDNALPLIYRLELGAALRHERFSIHGSSTTPKFSALWAPTRWLTIRGSYNRSFRAPNLAQTDTTQLLRVNYAADPYRYDATGFALDGSGPRRTLRQGNNLLDPERAENLALGFVLDVPGIRGLSLSTDYWRMKQMDAISSLTNGDVLSLDELALDIATREALAAGRDINSIDLGSGTSGYLGNTRVIRRPVTDADRAAFAAYNALQTSTETMRAPVGEIETMVVDYINLGSRKLSGLDFGLQYRSPMTTLGRFTLRAEATRNLQRKEDLAEDGIIIDQLGKDGYAKWVGNASLGWSKGNVAVSWLTTYYGSFSDTSADTTAAIYDALDRPDYINVFNDNGVNRYYYRVKAAVQHTLSATVMFGATINGDKPRHSVTATVHNVFDADPPLADEDNGFVVGTANARGRQFRLRYSFGF